VKKIDRERSLNIQFDFDDDELFILGSDLLEIVFDNILNNAIKHNKNATIEIKIKISKQERTHVNYLKIEFLDNGKGVSDTRKEIIFNRGKREIKNIYGMGLGLSLLKKIIETYNGEIWVEDRVKGDYLKGSNFILLIPEVL
jgi:signal transduction histidine kinase